MRFALSAALAAVLLLLSAASAHANSPAPWWACEGKAAGDACEPYGGDDGSCVLQASCTDDSTSVVNECLYCVSDGSGCSVVSGALAGSGALLLALAAFAVRRRRS